MIDLDELKEAAKAALAAPGRLKYGYPTSPEETLALVRVVRAALLVDANAWLGAIGQDDEAYRKRQEAADAFYPSLAPFRKDTA